MRFWIFGGDELESASAAPAADWRETDAEERDAEVDWTRCICSLFGDQAVWSIALIHKARLRKAKANVMTADIVGMLAGVAVLNLVQVRESMEDITNNCKQMVQTNGAILESMPKKLILKALLHQNTAGSRHICRVSCLKHDVN